MIRSPRVLAVLVLLSSVLLSWLGPWSALFGSYVPDLKLLAVVAIATRLAREDALLLAAATGLLAGVFSAEPLGARALIYVLVAWCSAAAAERINPAVLPTRLLLTALAVLGADAGGRLLTHLLDPAAPVPEASGLPARMLATSVAALLLWRSPARPLVGRTA